MKSMPRKTKKRSRSDWMQMVAEYEQADGQETQEAFARRNQLNVGTFRYWLYKAREEADSQPVRFVELMGAPSTGTVGDVEVTLDGGRCTVRFGSGADASWIGEVVAALAVRLQC
jgi:hypothetical protein